MEIVLSWAFDFIQSFWCTLYRQDRKSRHDTEFKNFWSPISFLAAITVQLLSLVSMKNEHWTPNKWHRCLKWNVQHFMIFSRHIIDHRQSTVFLNLTTRQTFSTFRSLTSVKMLWALLRFSPFSNALPIYFLLISFWLYAVARICHLLLLNMVNEKENSNK